MPIGFRMEVINYYIATLTTAFKNIAPVVCFIVGGYFIFVKMPFLFFRKSMSEQKKKFEENKNPEVVEKYTVENYREFQRTLKLMNGTAEEPGKEKQDQKKAEKEKTQQKKSEQQGTEQKRSEQKKKEERKTQERPSQQHTQTPEEIFNFKAGESFTKSELKKRYFELLKQNHPDRVAGLGPDFRKLAEKNTKEINKAFEVLKKRAS